MLLLYQATHPWKGYVLFMSMSVEPVNFCLLSLIFEVIYKLVLSSTQSIYPKTLPAIQNNLFLLPNSSCSPPHTWHTQPERLALFFPAQTNSPSNPRFILGPHVGEIQPTSNCNITLCMVNLGPSLACNQVRDCIGRNQWPTVQVQSPTALVQVPDILFTGCMSLGQYLSLNFLIFEVRITRGSL